MRKIAFRFEGVFATTDKITIRGKLFQFTEEQLREAAAVIIGIPVTMGHRGLSIGVVEKAWYSDGKLRGIGAIYEPRNEAEREAVEKVRSGEVRGLSLGFTYELPRPITKRVVIHGTLMSASKTEDGKMIVRGFFSKDDLKMAGTDDPANFKPSGKLWLHDGSKEAKKRIEKSITQEADDGNDSARGHVA